MVVDGRHVEFGAREAPPLDEARSARDLAEGRRDVAATRLLHVDEPRRLEVRLRLRRVAAPQTLKVT